MFVKDVLSLLLKKEIPFSSDDFVWNFYTREFSRFDLKLCGLWLILYAPCYSNKSRILSLLSPRITQLSLSGEEMLFAWPFDEDCHVVDNTEAE